MANSPKILLLGGGYTLSRLAKRLDSTRFVITTQSQSKKENFENLGWNSSVVSLSDKDSVKNLFSAYPSITTVVDSIPPFNQEEDPTSGIKNLLPLLPKSVSRIFYLSTTGVYGKTDGSWVTEESSCTPHLKRSQARIDSEALYISSNIPTTCFRLSGIYGPGRGLGLRLKQRIHKIIENQNRFTNRIHVDDIVGVLQSALNLKEKLPKYLNINDDDPAPTEEVVKYYIEKYDFPYPEIIPEEESKTGEKSRLHMNQRVSNALVKKTLNYEMLFPSYREGAGQEFLDSDNE